jgi:ABC-type Fe3+ transport system permease subunit
MRVLIELLPAIVPLVLCAAWVAMQRRQAAKRGEAKPDWKDGPWFWAVIASIVVAIVCLFLLGVISQSVKGAYEPAHLENGKLVPGKVNR